MERRMSEVERRIADFNRTGPRPIEIEVQLVRIFAAMTEDAGEAPTP